jgi:predicted glycosyltransferase
LAAKLHYTGYIQPDVSQHDPQERSYSFKDLSLPLVTLTLGGGGDGADILEMMLNHVEQLQTPPRFNLNILTGPFAPQNLVAKAKELTRKKDYIFGQEFVPNTFAVFKQSDLVVSMGGYNTMTELVAMKKYPLILPRVTPRKEQLLRAQVFKKMDYCDYMVPAEITPSSLFAKIDSMLSENKQAPHFPSAGLAEFKKWMEEQL